MPTDRSPSAVFADLPAEARAKLRRAAFPGSVTPMLATLTDRRDLDETWLLERKLDGERCLAFVQGGDVALRTRTGRDVTTTFPEVAAAAANVAGAAVLDGEVVAVDGAEALGFQQLQRRLGQARPDPALVSAVPVALWAFDVVHLEGRDTRALAQVDRKALLAAILRPTAALRYSEHERGDVLRRYRGACAAGWEGLMAKRADAPYRAGRTRDWLKLKCVGEQELVIGGYTDPKGRRVELGALLVGYHEDGRLRYAGKVGTGFDEAVLRDLGSRLRRLERPDSPFDEPVRPLPPGTHWVQPRLVGQIGFSEWTSAGRLRHPRFLGLRDDKAPEDVVREASA